MKVRMSEEYTIKDFNNLSDQDIKAIVSSSLEFSGISSPIETVIRDIIFKQVPDQIDWQYVWELIQHYMPEFTSKEYLSKFFTR